MQICRIEAVKRQFTAGYPVYLRDSDMAGICLNGETPPKYFGKRPGIADTDEMPGGRAAGSEPALSA